MNKRHYEHTLPNIRGSLSNTYNNCITTTLKTEEENGIQIIKKHRDIVPAATAVRDDIPGGVYAGNGICRMKGL